MHAWEQIQKTVDFIEEHLSKEITMEELAELSALSPFYYHRLFSRLVKKPVFEYIKLRRMAKAMELLRLQERRILDIALELGFTSHEHFTRTFKGTFGVTPEDYRKTPTAFNKMTKPELLLNYTIIDENVPLISDGIVLEISRKQISEAEYFIGLEEKTPVSFISGLGVESGIDPLYSLWDNFHEAKSGLQALLPGGDEISVAYPCAEEGYFSYFAGGQAKSGSSVKGYKNWELPAGEYVVCTFEAESFEGLVMDVLYKAQKYLFTTWLPNHKLTTKAFSAERYENHDEATTRMEIWVKPVLTE